MTATWAGDVRMQPAVAVELMEYRHYGLADMLSGRYLREARLGLELLPASPVSVGLDLRSVRLSTPGDGRYSPTLRQLVPAGGESPATCVGWELDLTLRIQLGELLLAGAGYAHLVPRSVRHERTPGGPRRYPRLLVIADV